MNQLEWGSEADLVTNEEMGSRDIIDFVGYENILL